LVGWLSSNLGIVRDQWSVDYQVYFCWKMTFNLRPGIEHRISISKWLHVNY
jgi:hypothetical protein